MFNKSIIHFMISFRGFSNSVAAKLLRNYFINLNCFIRLYEKMKPYFRLPYIFPYVLQLSEQDHIQLHSRSLKLYFSMVGWRRSGESEVVDNIPFGKKFWFDLKTIFIPVLRNIGETAIPPPDFLLLQVCNKKHIIQIDQHVLDSNLFIVLR